MDKNLLKKIANLLAIIIGTLSVLAFCYFFIYQLLYNGNWIIDIYKQHFAAGVGLPLAALVAGIIVVIFETKSGPIKFELWKFKFEGASGEIVMWILVFMSEAFMLKLLW